MTNEITKKEAKKLASEAKKARKEDHLKNYILKTHLNFFLTPKNIKLLGGADKIEEGQGKWQDIKFYLFDIKRIANEIKEKNIPLRLNEKFFDFYQERPWAFFVVFDNLKEELIKNNFIEILIQTLGRPRNQYQQWAGLIIFEKCHEFFDNETTKKIIDDANQSPSSVVRELAAKVSMSLLVNKHKDILSADPRLADAL